MVGPGLESGTSSLCPPFLPVLRVKTLSFELSILKIELDRPDHRPDRFNVDQPLVRFTSLFYCLLIAKTSQLKFLKPLLFYSFLYWD